MKLIDTDIYNYYLYQIHRLYKIMNPNCKLFFPYVLKTDAWNEAYQKPAGGIAETITGNTICLECDSQVYSVATAAGANVVLGDIRKIPFSDNSFDIILDLSTIDHVPFKELEKVWTEYKRVLKETGKLMEVVWFSTNPEWVDYSESRPYHYTNQYYFNYEKYLPLFKKYFKIVEEEVVLEVDTQRLIRFFADKK